MGVAELAAVGEAGPIAYEFVGVLAAAECNGFAGEQQRGAGSDGRGGLEQVTSRDRHVM